MVAIARPSYEAVALPYRKPPAESDPHGTDPHASGAKMDAGKQLAGVLLDFSRALGAVADVGTFGANKYCRGGWQSVPNAEERYLDAFMRHLLKMQRQPIDPDSNLDHLAHIAWNCLAVLELKARREEGQREDKEQVERVQRVLRGEGRV
jgi:hypothetical protein